MANNEWSTPLEYLEAARRVMGVIELDPATNCRAQEKVKALRCFIKEQGQDGLEAEWFGNIWLNPPYGRGEAKLFLDKLITSLPQIQQAIVLTNNVTDTKWFAETAGKYGAAFCFPDHRIQFVVPDDTRSSGNSHGQVFTYFGNNPTRFLEVFSQFGLVTIPWRK
jgi:hypothetical protein